MIELNNPRQLAKDAIKASVPATLWLENQKFVNELRRSLKIHPVATHPAIAALNQSLFDKEQLKRIHLDYRHGVVQVFTDALLMAQYQTRQLEPRLASGSKMYARFLVTLNNLDEFGFQPGVGEEGYRGNPYNAHYPLFERVLDTLGTSVDDRSKYIPTEISDRIRKYLEQSYDSLCSLTTLLGVIEEEVILFSAPLRENASTVGVNVGSGYYFCHGTTEDLEVDANDDKHQDDLWHVLMQALTPDQYTEVANLCNTYCDLWVEFWDEQMNLLSVKTPQILTLSR
jgi:hypothetical protein